LVIQLVIPDGSGYNKIIKDFDLDNAKAWSYPPFDEVQSFAGKKISISLDYMSFGLAQRILKYKFKGFDESDVCEVIFDFFLDYQNKTKYPKAFVRSGYENTKVEPKDENHIAWSTIATWLSYSIPFQEYCGKKEENKVLLPLWRMAHYHLQDVHGTVYNYHGYLKIQYERKFFKTTPGHPDPKPKKFLENQDEILSFMKKNYPEIVL